MGCQDEAFNRYVSMKQDKTIGTKTTEEINGKAQEALEVAKKLTETMRLFVVEVLVEFRAKKA